MTRERLARLKDSAKWIVAAFKPVVVVLDGDLFELLVERELGKIFLPEPVMDGFPGDRSPRFFGLGEFNQVADLAPLVDKVEIRLDLYLVGICSDPNRTLSEGGLERRRRGHSDRLERGRPGRHAYPESFGGLGTSSGR